MIYHITYLGPFLYRNIVPIICVVAILGAALWSLLAPAPKTPELDAALGRAKIEGIVIRDPDKREQTVRLTISLEKLNGALMHQSARILISADRFADVAYGDRIIASGILKRPESFETDTGRTFNYPQYLRAHAVTHEMSFPALEVIGHGEGNAAIGSLLSVKHALIRGIEKALPEPESALLAGLLLGEKQSLGDTITQAFRNAGVVHIIVLSGYNVALVIWFVLLVFSRMFSRTMAHVLGALVAVAFAVMTGLSETAIRATIMALIMMLATVLHRPKAALRALLIAAAAMALWNPYLVLYDLSFQLSVVATLGLILFSDGIAKKLPFIPNYKYLPFREIAGSTLATQITVLPLLILSIGAVSFVFLPANLLVLPAVPLAMFFGFFAACVALVSGMFAFPIAAVAYGILSYIIHVSVWLGSLPFSSVQVPAGWTGALLGILALCYGVGFLFYALRFTRARLG